MTTGCRSVISQITNTARAIIEMAAPMRMKLDSNQSRSLPLSRMICNAPTPMTRLIKPT
ncbi:hypothetical protein D3C72_2484270 [compost metagenome]